MQKVIGSSRYTKPRTEKDVTTCCLYGGESAPGALAGFVPADSVEFPLVMWPKNWGSNQKKMMEHGI